MQLQECFAKIWQLQFSLAECQLILQWQMMTSAEGQVGQLGQNCVAAEEQKVTALGNSGIVAANFVTQQVSLLGKPLLI